MSGLGEVRLGWARFGMVLRLEFNTVWQGRIGSGKAGQVRVG